MFYLAVQIKLNLLHLLKYVLIYHIDYKPKKSKLKKVNGFQIGSQNLSIELGFKIIYLSLVMSRKSKIFKI